MEWYEVAQTSKAQNVPCVYLKDLWLYRALRQVELNHKKIPLPLSSLRSSQDLGTRGSYKLFPLALLESESKKFHLI